MQIECPSCSKVNNLDIKKNVVCGACKKPLSGFKYKKHGKPILTVTSAIIIGALGYKSIDTYFLEEPRYPLPIEYSIIEACVNLHKAPLAMKEFETKREICLCSLEETMKDITYDSFKGNEDIFFDTFEGKINDCL